MKEATGEANMTIITVVLIGLVSAAAMLIVPRLIDQIKKRSCCTEAGGTWENAKCTFGAGADSNSYYQCLGIQATRTVNY